MPSRSHTEVDIAAVAALIGDPARSAMLDALLGGEALPAGELARRAGVAASTASEHVARLVAGGLVAREQRGREARHRLASEAVADALEALARLARPVQVNSLRGSNRRDAFRAGRTCYDHLAGRLGVALTEGLVARKALRVGDGCFVLTRAGESMLAAIGVDVEHARSQRRTFARACLDWSERRPHLGGALGAALAGALLRQDWLRRAPNDRVLTVTPTGERALRALGVDLSIRDAA